MIEACGPDFYASVAAARDAVRERKCFNLIHLPTSYKIDIFVNRGRQWDDVSRLVRLHGAELEIDYLRTMAESIGVRDLLDRLLAEVIG